MDFLKIHKQTIYNLNVKLAVIEKKDRDASYSIVKHKAEFRK